MTNTNTNLNIKTQSVTADASEELHVPFLLKPAGKDYLWGGTRLRDDFAKDFDFNPLAETWECSTHPDGQSLVASGMYEGQYLKDVLESHPEFIGTHPQMKDGLPVLVKFIDAKADLSIQVHPDDAYAAEHENGSLGKMECWYILDAKEGGTIVIGHNAKNHEEVEEMIRGKRWKEFIREIPVKKGDFFQINPGCVHAIKGGTLILETQQNSDITYRVYDYDRLQDGKPRALHVQQSIDVIKAPFEQAVAEHEKLDVEGAKAEKLVSCPCYTVCKATVNGTAEFDWNQPFVDISVLDGEGSFDGTPVKKGTHLIVPACYGKMKAEGKNLMMIYSYITEK